MDRRQPPSRIVIAWGAALAAAAGLGAGVARAEPAGDGAEAGPKCEAEVGRTLARLHGKEARELRFDAAKRAVVRSDGEDLSVRGEGRWQDGGGAVPFQYSCAYNARTGEASGVVLRELGGTRAGAAPQRAWEPDLAKLSPVDCESATAALLKDRNPRIARIAFDAETRRVEPTGDALRIGLEGRGALQRAPGTLSLPFSYRCEFDTRNGRVVAVQARE